MSYVWRDTTTLEVGDYVYEWTEEDRESQRPSSDEPSDSEMAKIRAALRKRDLTTVTDDCGTRVTVIDKA